MFVCVRWLVCIAMIVAVGGCASSREMSDGIDPSDRLGQVPEDLSIDAMVLVGGPRHASGAPASSTPPTSREGQSGGRGPGRGPRAGRFLLMPDATMRYTPDPQPRAHAALPRVRRLSREQIAGVWAQTVEFDLAPPAPDPDAGAAAQADAYTGNPALIEPPAAGQIVHIVTIYAGDQHRTTVHRFAAGEAPEPRIEAFIESLAALAWVDLQRVPERAILPQRYDFGPDPYARYRRQNETTDEHR